ncbi:MAG: endonuclease/exonuclease/phosphatase family protein [Muribaculaceae bacterium]
MQKPRRHSRIPALLKLIGAIFSAVVAVMYLASAYGGIADPVTSAKLSVLGLAYPIALAVALVLMVVWLCLRQWLLALIPLLAIVASWGPITTFSPINFVSRDVAEGDCARTFTVLTYNVMNFTDNTGVQHTPNRTIQYILDRDADVVCLQEAAQERNFDKVEYVSEMLEVIKEKYPYYHNHRSDVVLLSKYPIVSEVDSVYFDNHIRAVGWDVAMPDDTVRVYSCHLESIGLTQTDKHLYRQLTRLHNMGSTSDLDEVRGTLVTKLARAYRCRSLQARLLRDKIDDTDRQVILCGDFNDTPGSFAYRTIMGSDMRDAYAECALGPTITYHCNRFYFRIDHILYRGNFDAVKIERGSLNASDHYPLCATFEWTDDK